MLTNYRVRKTFKGWVVECEAPTWSLFGLKKRWKPFLTYFGSKSPFYFKDFISAQKQFENEMRYNLLYYSELFREEC